MRLHPVIVRPVVAEGGAGCEGEDGAGCEGEGGTGCEGVLKKGPYATQIQHTPSDERTESAQKALVLVRGPDSHP